MTIFEKTMQACLQDGATSKKLAEKKNVKKTSKKTITEKKSLRRKFEADEPEFDDEFADDFGGDEFADDFGGDDEFTDADDVAGGVEDDISIKPDFEDDIATVVDPNEDNDDNFLADALQYFQDANEENIEVAEDAIENAEDGEEVKTDDYVGQNVYICPICGSTFFNDGELGEGDACPVCGETPEAFVSCGIVEANDNEDADEKKDDDEEEVAEDVEELEDDIEETEEDIEDVEEDEEDEEDEDKAKEEAYRRRAAMRRKAEARRRMEARRRAESKKSISRETRKPVQRKAESRKQPEYMLNEKTFERHLCRFFAENYSNVDDVTIRHAIMKEGKLGVGATLTFKSGKKKDVPFVVENFTMKSGVYSVKDTKNAFEAKSSKNPFKFKIKVEGNVVSCLGMAYKYETKSEGKRVLVSGTTLTESKKKINKPAKFEADKKDDKKTDDKKATKKTTGKSKPVSELDEDQLSKICAILDYWTYDLEEDGGREFDTDEEADAAKYTKKDKEKAAKMGKLCPLRNINGSMTEPKCCEFLKKERPDLYDAIANCDDKKERQKIFRQIRTAAENGEFKKKF